MRRATRLASLFTMVIALSVFAQGNPREELTEGKLAVDLGQAKEAQQILSSLAYRPDVPPEIACEALVRLAAFRWQRAHDADAVRAWKETTKRCAGDKEAMRLVAEFVTGVAQDPATWRGRAEDFTLVFTDDGDPAATELGLKYVSEEARDPFSAAAALGAGKAWSGDPVSINVQDAELTDLFRLFHEVSGLNIVVDPRVKGKTITLNLVEVPWDQALSLVLQTQGLGVSVKGNVMRIAPMSVLAGERFTGRAEDLEAQHRTLEILTRIAAAAQALRERAGRWGAIAPPRDVGDVTMAFEIVRGSEFPTIDAWGHPIRYWSDGGTMRLVSSGKDGVFEHPDLVGYVPGVAHHPADDIAWENDHALTFLVTPPSAP